MRSKSAREETVAIGIVQEHARARTSCNEGSSHDFRKNIDVVACVTYDGGSPGSAAAGMDANGLFAWYGEHDKGIVVFQVLLSGEGQSG